MVMSPTSSCDIYVASYGFNPRRTVTTETIAVLKSCRRICFLKTNSEIEPFLQGLRVNYTVLDALYVEGSVRANIYENIAKWVVNDARKEPGVCYLTYGNPMIFDEPTRLIIDEAAKLGLTVEVLPGISFIDRIIAHFRIPIIAPGVQVYEASAMIEEKLKIENRAPCFIAQVGAFQDEFAAGKTRNLPQKYYQLVNYLRLFYPPDHVTHLYDLTETSDSQCTLQIPLCMLPLASEGITYGTTLYLPAKR